jgi:uncharacterized protein YlxP (DUF503 family)
MFVGVLRLTFHIPSARSLKDRRRVVQSFKDRLQARLRVAVAEVGGLEQHQRAVIGVATISNEAARVDEMLGVAAAMAGNVRDAVLVHRASEIVPFGDEGAGLGQGAPGAPGAAFDHDGWEGIADTAEDAGPFAGERRGQDPLGDDDEEALS